MTPPPLALIAELTHRCPLHCLYCSNPIELMKRKSELEEAQWIEILEASKELGIYQIHFTGGEPLLRPDLENLVRVARMNGLYSNLITSGVGLSDDRLARLVEMGLDHIQLSIQGINEAMAYAITRTKTHLLKLEVAKKIKKHPIAFTINLVIHNKNLDFLPELFSLAESYSPDKIEVAHTQYYGWAFQNREELLPTSFQVRNSIQYIEEAKRRLEGKIRIDFVLPDYYAKFPKPCMGGWGKKVVLIQPNGTVLPCHSAGIIPGINFENVTQRKLKWIWEESESFNRFRGTHWMNPLCSSCENKEKDFGGCRCQAYLLTGDPYQTDPICTKSSQNDQIKKIRNIHNSIKPPLVIRKSEM